MKPSLSGESPLKPTSPMPSLIPMRFLRFLFATALLLGFGPGPAFAQETPPPTKNTPEETSLAQAMMRTNRSKVPVRMFRPQLPNIIFIVADDLGYGDLGSYGQKLIQTPNLDQLAAEGIRFTSFYAGSTVCAPSRSSLMTGQHTGHTPIRGNAKMPLGTNVVTVAKALRPAGYVSAVIGKWGLGNEGTTGEPNRQGFDEQFGFLDQTEAHNYYPETLVRNGARLPIAPNQQGRKGLYVQDLFTTTALNFISQYKQRPFFLYLAYTTPHAHNAVTKATGNGMEVPSDAPYTTNNWPQPEKNKAAMITRLDAHVGAIMKRIKDENLDGQTIVFFTSDNGPHKEGGNDPAFFQSSGPFRGIKRDLTEGGIRVPMIVRGPGRVPVGKVSDFPWAFWDFLPTATELAGTKTPSGIDGRSVLPTLLGKEQKPAEFFYWEFHEGGSKQAVRMGDWKAIRPFEKPLQLFNLKSDPGETNNVASANAEVVKKIEEYLAKARTESETWPLKGPAPKQAKKKKE